MDCLNTGAPPREAASDVHETRAVECGAVFGSRPLEGAAFVFKHRRRYAAVLEREGSAESAAFLVSFELDEFEIGHFRQQLSRSVADSGHAQ